MRLRLALAGRADADVAGVGAELLEVGGAEVAHAGLDAADEFAEYAGEGAGRFFQRFDAFGGCFGGDVLAVVPIAGGGAVLHGRAAAHAAVLLIKFAVDLDDLAGRFVATGQQAAAHDAVGEGEGLDHIARFGDAAVCEDGDALFAGGDGGAVECGHLRDTDACNDTGGADGAGALADFDGVGTGIGEEFDAFGAGHVTGDERELGEFGPKHADGITHTFGKTVGGGDGNGIDAFIDELADMAEDAVAVEFAVRLAVGGNGGAAHQAEVAVAGGFDRLLGLLLDALDVAEGEEAAEAVLFVDDQKFVDAEVLGEKFIGGFDRVFDDVLFGQRIDLVAGRHGLGDVTVGVAAFDDASGEEAEQLVVGIDDREGAEAEAAVMDVVEHFADFLMGADFNGLLNEAVNVILHAGDFFDLLLVAHVVVDESEPAVECHLDGHFRFGHGVHVRRDDRDLELERGRELRREVCLARQDLGVKSREGNVVVGETDGQIAEEELVSGLIVVFDSGCSGCFHVLTPPKDCLFSSRNDSCLLNEPPHFI